MNTKKNNILEKEYEEFTTLSLKVITSTIGYQVDYDIIFNIIQDSFLAYIEYTQKNNAKIINQKLLKIQIIRYKCIDTIRKKNKYIPFPTDEIIKILDNKSKLKKQEPYLIYLEDEDEHEDYLNSDLTKKIIKIIEKLNVTATAVGKILKRALQKIKNQL